MSLYISSSNNKVNNIILTALYGFVIYSLILFLFNPNITTFQNQWIKNYSQAEKYIYKKEKPEIVIVGTSMAARLQNEQFSHDIYNLSFTGSSPLTGLNIAKRAADFPEAIYIETNFIERKSDQDMIDKLFTPFLFDLKKYVISLRYTYQPINIFLTLIKKYFGSNEDKNHTPNEEYFKKILLRQITENNNIDMTSYSNEISELKDIVKYFVSSGVKIVFFEMPVHKDLLLSNKYAAQRSILIETFPDINFNWINEDAADNYETADGLHLLDQSAIKFTKELNNIMGGIKL